MSMDVSTALLATIITKSSNSEITIINLEPRPITSLLMHGAAVMVARVFIAQEMGTGALPFPTTFNSLIFVEMA